MYIINIVSNIIYIYYKYILRYYIYIHMYTIDIFLDILYMVQTTPSMASTLGRGFAHYEPKARESVGSQCHLSWLKP